MNIKTYLIITAACLPLALRAQTIDFETSDGYTAIGVYDTWEASPFRTGKLEGNAAVIPNPFREASPQATAPANPTTKVLAVQRSRFGSNTFGARIDLTHPFELTPEVQYVHVYLHKPVEGRVMLIGLGKRADRPGQDPYAEQFWQFSATPIPPGEWCDAVFPVKGAGGILINSLVLVPHCESPHNLREDFAAYIDEITVNNTPTPRIRQNSGTTQDSNLPTSDDKHCNINNANRNGEILAADGTSLNNYQAPAGQPFTVLIRPANGFTCTGILLRRTDLPASAPGSEAIHFPASLFTGDTFTIPAQYLTGTIELEGIFTELKQ